LKEKLQPAQFSSIRQVCIEQDFAAGLLLLNLQSLFQVATCIFVRGMVVRGESLFLLILMPYPILYTITESVEVFLPRTQVYYAV
jgi:hypothetical protein